MSIDYTVYARTIPDHLEESWLRVLQEFGFACELRPGTSLLAEDHETGPYLKITTFPSSAERIKPELPLLAGFGLSVVRMGPREISELPEIARGCTHRLAFYTSAGRSPIAHAIQAYGAAAMAMITNGVFRDPQRGVMVSGEAAVQQAKRSAGGENLEDGATPWYEWPPESVEEEDEYEFPPPIQVPERQGWLSKLLSLRIG